MIFCLCASHYSWTSSQNLNPLLLQCNAHHSGFQNGDLCHIVYNLQHFVLISAMTVAQIQSYQGSLELLHGLTAFPYAWMNYRIALDGCKARGKSKDCHIFFNLIYCLALYTFITTLLHYFTSCIASQTVSQIYITSKPNCLAGNRNWKVHKIIKSIAFMFTSFTGYSTAELSLE